MRGAGSLAQVKWAGARELAVAERYQDFDEDDDRLMPIDERDEPRDEDMDPPEAEDEVDLIRCPLCRREVYAEASQCNHCGHHLSEPPGDSKHNPLFLFAVLVMVAIVAMWMVVRML